MNSTSPGTLVIQAGQADQHYWRDLWRYRELLGFLAWRDIKVRYKQAVLGITWSVIQPAVQTVLLTFVFSKLAKMPDGGVPYPMLVLAGLLPWQLFSSAFGGASNSLVGNANLISKIYFPRLIVPLSALAVALVDLLLAIAFPVSLLYGVMPTWRLLLLPLFIFLGLLTALGAGLWITALTVKYRDFRFITPFLLQIGLFVTPIGYRTDFLPNWRDLLALNPLTGVVNGFRWCLLGVDMDFYASGLIMSVLISAILLGTGLWYFRGTERQFADVI
jgi:lipopolysaccharide transport system permease protein